MTDTLFQIAPWQTLQIFKEFAAKAGENFPIPQVNDKIAQHTADYEQYVRQLWQQAKENPTKTNILTFIEAMITASEDTWRELYLDVLDLEELLPHHEQAMKKEVDQHIWYLQNSLYPDLLKEVGKGTDAFNKFDYRIIFMYSGALWSSGMLATVMFDGLEFRDLADLFLFSGPNDSETCTGPRGCDQHVGKIYTVAEILSQNIIPGKLQCYTNCRHMLIPIASPLNAEKHMSGKHNQKSHGTWASSLYNSVRSQLRKNKLLNLQDSEIHEMALAAVRAEKLLGKPITDAVVTSYLDHPFNYQSALTGISDRASELQSILLNSRIPSDLTVYRGVSESHATQLRAMKVGDVLPLHKNFTSTSLSPVASSIFAAGTDMRSSKDSVVYTIELKAGDNGAFVDHLASEVLLPAGISLRRLPATPEQEFRFEVVDTSEKHMAGKHSQASHNPHKGSSSSGRVFNGEPIPWSGKKLTKLEVGEIGEQLAMRILSEQLGHPFSTLNEGVNNAPIDVAGDHVAVEVKTGLASNGKTAQHWRATIGQPGKAESELIAQMTKEEKRAHNQMKYDAILERKASLLAEMSAMAGSEVRGMTVGIILHPDGKKADVYQFDGFHLRIPWNKAEEVGTFMGSYDV